MIKYEWVDEDGDDVEFEFPHRFILCGSCKGEGSFFVGSAEHNDQEYRATCDCCNGVRVLKIVDEEGFDDEDHAMYKDYKAAEKRHESYRSEERFAQDYS